jgi:hypothetical protein
MAGGTYHIYIYIYICMYIWLLGLGALEISPPGCFFYDLFKNPACAPALWAGAQGDDRKTP